jgi:hypothetical protein
MIRTACDDKTVRYVRDWVGGEGGKAGNVDDKILAMSSGKIADGCWGEQDVHRPTAAGPSTGSHIPPMLGRPNNGLPAINKATGQRFSPAVTTIRITVPGENGRPETSDSHGTGGGDQGGPTDDKGQNTRCAGTGIQGVRWTFHTCSGESDTLNY